MDPTSYRMAHSVYSPVEIEDVHYTHLKPKNFRDRLAKAAVTSVRFGFDTVTGYSAHNMTASKWLTRIIFLETIAGVPGMVGGMARHMKSLRRMERDHGWIHKLLSEAENERMHLFIFLDLKQPSWAFRTAICGAQGIFFNFYFLAYLLSPKFCHRFVGYLEEEAVKTYSILLKHMDDGHLPEWDNMPAPTEARQYYGLDETATFRDVVLAVRADEAGHREHNHHFSDLNANDEFENDTYEILKKE